MIGRTADTLSLLEEGAPLSRHIEASVYVLLHRSTRDLCAPTALTEILKETLMGMRSTTQAFQFNVPFEQLFPAATQAVQAVKKATRMAA